MPLTGLMRGLKKEDPQAYVTFDESLAVLTLGALVRRDDERAADVLRRYVSFGKHWHMAVEQFRIAGRPDAWQGLNEVLDRRFSSAEQFDESWHYYVEHGEPPWSEWKATDGPLGEWLRGRERREREHAREVRKERRAARQFPALTTAELLDYAGRHGITYGLTKELAKRTPADLDVLLAAIEAGPHWSTVAALAALRGSKDDRVFEAAVRIIEAPHQRARTFKQRMAIARLRVHAGFILQRFQARRTLPLARKWRSASSWRSRPTAYHLLTKHATADDLPWVRKQLSKPITRRRIYKMCDLAEIFTRFPDHGPFPQLVRLYYAFPYSFGRSFIVQALAVTTRDLARDALVKSLWDCEPSVREIACRDADINANGVRDRLRELAGDQFEEDDVRKAAASRLN